MMKRKNKIIIWLLITIIIATLATAIYFYMNKSKKEKTSEKIREYTENDRNEDVIISYLLERDLFFDVS